MTTATVFQKNGSSDEHVQRKNNGVCVGTKPRGYSGARWGLAQDVGMV